MMTLNKLLSPRPRQSIYFVNNTYLTEDTEVLICVKSVSSVNNADVSMNNIGSDLMNDELEYIDVELQRDSSDIELNDVASDKTSSDLKMTDDLTDEFQLL